MFYRFLLLISACALTACQTTSGPVLIIGDSIAAGYTPYVQQTLPCVDRIYGDGFRDTRNILKNLDKWLAVHQYGIIHFNAGLWDIAHRMDHRVQGSDLDPTDQAPIAVPPDEYRSNLEKIITRMQKTGALVIFATTTDVPEGSKGRISTDVDKYNKIAVQVMKERGVLVDDLNNWMKGQELLHIDDNGNKVHYSDAGYQLLAQKVVTTLVQANACNY